MPESRSAPSREACSASCASLSGHPEHAGQAIVDQLAEAMLRMLGIPAAEAARLAAVPLPETGARR